MRGLQKANRIGPSVKLRIHLEFQNFSFFRFAPCAFRNQRLNIFQKLIRR